MTSLQNNDFNYDLKVLNETTSKKFDKIQSKIIHGFKKNGEKIFKRFKKKYAEYMAEEHGCNNVTVYHDRKYVYVKMYVGLVGKVNHYDFPIVLNTDNSEELDEIVEDYNKIGIDCTPIFMMIFKGSNIIPRKYKKCFSDFKLKLDGEYVEFRYKFDEEMQPQIDNAKVVENFYNNSSDDGIKAVLGINKYRKPVGINFKQTPNIIIPTIHRDSLLKITQSMVASMASKYKHKTLDMEFIDYLHVNLSHMMPDNEKDIPISQWYMTGLEKISKVIAESIRRQSLIENSGHNNIKDYNEDVPSDKGQFILPNKVIFINDFYDVQLTSPKIAKEIIRMMKISHITGIHFVILTNYHEPLIENPQLQLNASIISGLLDTDGLTFDESTKNIIDDLRYDEFVHIGHEELQPLKLPYGKFEEIMIDYHNRKE